MSYRVTDRRRVFSGTKVNLEVHQIVDDAGKTHEREIVLHGGAVAILGVTADDQVVIIRVHRYPVDASLWELPAGTLEEGEDPAKCAARELKEETGYAAGNVEPLGSFYTSPGILTERMHCYIATDLTAGEQALEEGENIEVHAMSLAEALELIDTGELVDGKTIAALLMYARRLGGEG